MKRNNALETAKFIIFLLSAYLLAFETCAFSIPHASSLSKLWYPRTPVEIKEIPLSYQNSNDSITKSGIGDIVKKIVYPDEPILLHINKLESLVFRTELAEHETANIRIYLCRGDRLSDVDQRKSNQKPRYSKLKELGKLRVASGLRDYMILWVPQISDGIDPQGGDDYFIAFSKTSWWGWWKERVFESKYAHIVPSKQVNHRASYKSAPLLIEQNFN